MDIYTTSTLVVDRGSARRLLAGYWKSVRRYCARVCIIRPFSRRRRRSLGWSDRIQRARTIATTANKSSITLYTYILMSIQWGWIIPPLNPRQYVHTIFRNQPPSLSLQCGHNLWAIARGTATSTMDSWRRFFVLLFQQPSKIENLIQTRITFFAK